MILFISCTCCHLKDKWLRCKGNFDYSAHLTFFMFVTLSDTQAVNKNCTHILSKQNLEYPLNPQGILTSRPIIKNLGIIQFECTLIRRICSNSYFILLDSNVTKPRNES